MKKLLLFIILIFYFLGISSVRAENIALYFSPSAGTYLVGSNFFVNVEVNSGGTPINAAEGTISFNADKISILSISRSDSIFTLWIEEPTFSNSAGTIKFSGGATKNFTGNSGKIITINFLAKNVGNSNLTFSNASVLAADFKGTNVLTNMGLADFIISLKTIIPPPAIGSPPAPEVTSSTHPNSNNWYSNNDPLFKWEVTEDITGARLLIDQKKVSIPDVFYSEPLSEKQIEDLADGIWYFHIQLQNKFGWGGISHYKIQIDKTSPELFETQVKEGTETTNPQPTLIFDIKDTMSGIDYYEVKIDQGAPIKIEEKEYKIPPQSLGKHTIIVRAFDKAGNGRLGVTEINILQIETPIITKYPKTLLPDSILSIEGTAFPESTIRVHILKDEKEIKIGEVKSDAEGKWSYTETQPLEKGVYNIWVEVTDSLGGRSASSDKITIQVTPPIFIRIGKLAIDYLTTIITLFILIFVMTLGILWMWRKIKGKRMGLKKEITEAEKALYNAFKTLTEETKKKIAKMDGEPDLNKREKKLCDDLKETLKNSEKIIAEEIKDIKKELE